MISNFSVIGHFEKVEKQEDGYVVYIRCLRSYACSDGSTKEDLFPIQIWRGMHADCLKRCQKGAIIATKGRIEMEHGSICLIAERVTYLKNLINDEVNLG